MLTFFYKTELQDPSCRLSGVLLIQTIWLDIAWSNAFLRLFFIQSDQVFAKKYFFYNLSRRDNHLCRKECNNLKRHVDKAMHL